MSIVAASNRIASARKTSANAKRKLMSSDEKSYALPLELESKMAMEDLNKLVSKDFRSSSTSTSTTTASPSSFSSSSSSSTSSSSSSFSHLIAHTAVNELSVKANLFQEEINKQLELSRNTTRRMTQKVLERNQATSETFSRGECLRSGVEMERR
ncbi:uncharacterized protein MONOS_14557 [Monocercomonoides exilis]|uniref:uncharacterized protein n=1 Tax=Monocercomonoides exilis TaxID=2049356 RepID=UPI003559CA79|nr:hypothetical protein MONOS_14557 [Monocercomonoides exilis]|eukprot:MONOS_14557.1-p1 / transcript=MONOS_14557.1 / gene=MONOS_14557 / organism=Monocercomonoides_exilis_PA203 / gene_product=unspecified product / transcript_product=unspecified product / location=Mono_scaffold01024:13544-14008(-) / protein_length=155 / sequence_SO=supercontig / SO=protein_coding / is_pseudo=false